MSTDNKLLHYWRNCLADSNRMDVSQQKEGAVFLPLEDIEQGRIVPEKTHQIFEQKKKQLKRNLGNKYRDQPISEAAILISPGSLVPHREHGVKRGNRSKDMVQPFWIPAKLKRSGELIPNDNLLPWFTRNVLEPVVSAQQLPTVSTVEVVDRSLGGVRFPEEPDWNKFWDCCNTVFRKATNYNISELNVSSYNWLNESLILIDDEFGSASNGILELYDYLRDQKSLPALFEAATRKDPPPLKTCLPGFKLDNRAKLHLGQMSDAFALSESQRQTLDHYFELQHGELLAVNGPPGTGKTTLLQSIVAQSVVESALQGENPAITVVTSTNNQAIQNVLESFAANPARSKDSLYKRWIPNIEGFGTSLISSAQKERLSNSQLTLDPGGNGWLPNQEKNEEFVKAAELNFLMEANAWFDKDWKKLEVSIDFIQEQIRSTTSVITQGVELKNKVDALEEQDIKSKEHGGIEGYRTYLLELLHKIKQILEKARKVQNDWNTYTRNEPILDNVLSFLPSVKEKRRSIARSILSEFPISFSTFGETNPRKIGYLIELEIQQLELEKEAIEFKRQIAKQNLEKKEKIVNEWNTWKQTFVINESSSEDLAIAFESSVIDKLDTEVRSKAFWLAVHYWEARWILEAKQRLGKPKKESSKQRISNLFYRQAMLTPCFVSTAYMLPKFISYSQHDDESGRFYNVPLLEFIDLLVYDEAGQVSPEVGSAAFALAKKALVVGDEFQISPVWNLNRVVDAGNMVRHHLVPANSGTQQDERVDQMHRTGRSASRGSLIKLAQFSSFYQLEDYPVRGMLLREHRRCLPEIIEYCNELAYNGDLVPKRESEENCLFPPIGYAHIPSYSIPAGGSRKNESEATVIARWIKENQQKIEDEYQRPWYQSVGIVTPFGAQKNEIFKRLREEKLELPRGEMKIGTVHALQGAERSIVLFSPTYGFNELGKSYFFDRGVNMLNVAVSRAKDSFLVFGEMALFDARQSTPSGLLARYLFSDPKNELIDVPLLERPFATPTTRLTTLEDHRETLKQAIMQTERELVILSPYLSIYALEADHLPEAIKVAVQDGKQITVITDAYMDDHSTQRRESSQKARTAIEEAGAVLKLAHGVHHKALIKDDEWLIEGSFNWLSAARDESSPYHRYEVSNFYAGDDVKQTISQLLDDLEKLVKR